MTKTRRGGRGPCAIPILACLGLVTSIGLAQGIAAPGSSGYAGPEDAPASVTRAADVVYRAPAIDTLATVRNRGVLRACVATNPPMVMRNAQGELVGYSIDIARRLADDLGTGVELVQSSWTRIIPALLDNRCDVIIAGLWLTPARALVVNYSEPTSQEGIHLIASVARASGMKRREDFDRPDVRIAAYAGTVQEQLARKIFPRATLVSITGGAAELDSVLEGKVHAVLVPTFAPRVLVAAAPKELFLPFDAPLRSTSTAMAVRKGDPDFLNFLNSWTTIQRDEGWLEERSRFWSRNTEWLK